MRKDLLGLALLAGVSCAGFAGGAQAAPQIGAAVLDESTPSALLQDVAIKVRYYAGHRYCFYFDGWHGAGWYRCGWAWRRGFGWGGVYGWNNWEYGPAARRFGHRGFRGERYGRGGDVEIRSGRRGGETEFRSGGRSGDADVGGSGGGRRSGTFGTRGTTGAGGAAIQGGGRGGAAVEGGASTGGGAAGSLGGGGGGGSMGGGAGGGMGGGGEGRGHNR
jgi:hypothetical protein